MAGNYPDVPSWRFAYDRDGTQVFQLNITTSSVVKQFTSTEVRAFNDETGLVGDTFQNLQYLGVCFIFPELRDLDAYLFQVAITQYSLSNAVVAVSSDTTNGIDGTWTSLGAWTSKSFSVEEIRTGVTSTTALGIKAIRFTGTGSSTSADWAIHNIHLFGEPIPGANPNRLDLWDPSSDQRVTPAFFDFGEFARQDTEQKTFRVKNRSATQTATSIRVAMEALSDKTPSVPGQFQLSLDGNTYLPQVNIGDLAPGATSAPIILRGSLTDTAVLGLSWFRVFAEGTWA